jgi:hypothetical protein
MHNNHSQPIGLRLPILTVDNWQKPDEEQSEILQIQLLSIASLQY